MSWTNLLHSFWDAGSITAPKALNELALVDAALAGVARKWYSNTITHGAHPNQAGIIDHIAYPREDSEKGIKVVYCYAAEDPFVRKALYATIQTGCLALGLMALVFDDDPFAKEAERVAKTVSGSASALFRGDSGDSSDVPLDSAVT